MAAYSSFYIVVIGEPVAQYDFGRRYLDDFIHKETVEDQSRRSVPLHLN